MKIYQNGEVYDGAAYIRKVEDQEILDWLFSLTFSKRKKIIADGTEEKFYSEYMKDEMPLPEAMKKSGFIKDTGSHILNCEHIYLFLEKDISNNSYVFCCRKCLDMEVIKK